MLSRFRAFFEEYKTPPLDASHPKNAQALGAALLSWLPRQDNVIATHLSGNERKIAIFYKNGTTHWLDLADACAALRRMIDPQRRRYLFDLSDPNFVKNLNNNRLV